MTREQFYQLLQNPSGISYQHIEQLKDVLEQFPYFQTARMIYTKGLHDNESFLYSEELKKTAIYAGDRSVLHQLINGTTAATSTDTLSITTQKNVSSETVTPAMVSVEENIFESSLDNTVGETILFNDAAVLREEVGVDNKQEIASVAEEETETLANVESASNELNIETDEPVAEIIAEPAALTAAQILELRLSEINSVPKDELEETIQQEIIAQNFLGFDEKTEDLSFIYQSEEIKISLAEEEPQEEVQDEITKDKTVERFTEPTPPQPQTSTNYSFTDWLHQLKPLSAVPTSSTVETNKAAVIESYVTSSIEKKNFNNFLL
jgi:hypothetical protein